MAESVHHRTALCSIAGVPAAVVSALAQETVPVAIPQGTGLADIVVTAQKRTENIQSAPIPITAILTLRGIGAIEPDPFAGNRASIVQDGVPQYFSMGALFGANTIGGGVNVVPRQPTGESGARGKVTDGNRNRMGGDADSVVDPQLQVRGVEGLRVADCSVMPALVSGNTNAPAMAMGWCAADIILAH